jgi:HD-GYP domain-containing protein (c-di-GMP phosphodiesterase class II)
MTVDALRRARPAIRGEQRAIIERAAQTAREMLGMDVAFVSDTRDGEQAYTCVAGDGARFAIAAGSTVPLPGTYCEVLLAGELAPIVTDAAADPVARTLAATERCRIGAYIGVPVELPDGSVYGTFCCLSGQTAPALLRRDARFLEVLARLIGDTVAEAERAAGARRTELAAGNVQALLVALGARDGYTEQHSQSVVDLALAVGRRLGLDDEELEDLEYAALLHDIGKLGIADATLRKTGPLDADEWREMRRHPEIGEGIVRSMPSLAHLAPIIRAEHERWDGAGYPDGLSGRRIPRAARIVLACDAYHAMISDRPYRLALGRHEALAELERNAGTQFCPQTAPVVVAVLSDQR